MSLRSVAAGVVLVLSGAALSAAPPPVVYDENLVPDYVLPELLVSADGAKVSDAKTWREKRRSEILRLFETEVYGRALVGQPLAMDWNVAAEDQRSLNGAAINKHVTITFTKNENDPRLNLDIWLPTAKLPAPVFVMPSFQVGGERYVSMVRQIIERGYGLAAFNPTEVEPDSRKGYEKGIRKALAPAGPTAPPPDAWGAIAAWAWSMSRAVDYLQTDRDVDSTRLCAVGFSRYGKAAMWAGAQDERFALVVSGESGCGGVVIVRRGYGETVRAINDNFPHWFNDNFKGYNERVNELPVDWHMLVALIAPRPVYIATAEEDRWGDPRGSFLSGKHAGAVYELFGKHGLGVDEMPPVETPVGNTIGYHNRKGGHGFTEYDWKQVLDFADRQLPLRAARASAAVSRE